MAFVTPTITPEVIEASSGIGLSFLNRRWVMVIPYAVLLVIFWILAGTALHRMRQIQIKGDSTGTVITVFLILSILILVATLAFCLTVDWGKPIFLTLANYISFL